MEPAAAAAFLQQPWNQQKGNMRNVKAAWQAVVNENPWITLAEWSSGDWWPLCRPCQKWCTDDHAASRCCMAKQQQLGNEPGYVLSAIIAYKRRQRTAAIEDAPEDRGSQHVTRRAFPSPPTVTQVAGAVPVHPSMHYTPAPSYGRWGRGGRNSRPPRTPARRLPRLQPQPPAPAPAQQPRRCRI